MKQGLLLLNLFFLVFWAHGQDAVQGVLADSATRQVLPFSTVQTIDKKHSAVSDINGRFRMSVAGLQTELLFSYTGHRSKQIRAKDIKDTVFLSAAGEELSEFIVAPVQDKIRRIINNAVAHRLEHNPELYDYYSCTVYYKMQADLLGASDSNAFFARDKFLFLSETFSQRLYHRPQQVQELIVASRFSGLQKTYFTNMITDVLPFHIYTPYISLNERDYVNPIAPGWSQRYRFRLEDELTIDTDTVYVLSFAPRKGEHFNALLGTVYINTNGFAISHMVAATADTAADRRVQFEQIYTFTKGRWFPKELNYHFTVKHFISPEAVLKWEGHSTIDSVSFDAIPSSAFDRAHPLKLSDSVDLHTHEEWAHYRHDTLSLKEQTTYVYLDSFVRVNKLERLLTLMGRLMVGRLPVGKFDLDIDRFLVSNNYEGTRPGLGLYTNDKISTYFSAGGWAGYGFNDKVWKYGGSLTVYPNGKKENWLTLAYRKDYDNPGSIPMHEELQSRFTDWLLGQVDQVEEYAATANLQLGYWQLRPALKKGTAQPLYSSSFVVANKALSFYHHREANLGLRFAYGEKRYPVFDYYEAGETKYPVVYLNLGAGTITASGYDAHYQRLLAAITYRHHASRWGMDHFRLDAGFINTPGDVPLPQSYLLAGNGVKTGQLSFYVANGFLSMQPFDYYLDRFVSFYYVHDFDKYLWETGWSRPYISLAHNLGFGALSERHIEANSHKIAAYHQYHESGILFNQLLRLNLHFADVFGHAGVFYHWNPDHDWQSNSTYVVGVGLGF